MVPLKIFTFPMWNILEHLAIWSLVKLRCWPGFKGHSSTRATPGELTFSTFPYITWRTVYMKNRKFSRLKVVLFGGRVTLQAGANVSLYLAHPVGSSRSRRDSLGMRESCFIQTEHARALLALVKWPSLFSYKRSLWALVYSKSPKAKGYVLLLVVLFGPDLFFSIK